MKTTLLVGSADFWNSLEADIRSASQSVLVQTLSFEGDRTGQALSGAMRASSAADRRIIVDSFTKHFISDRSVHSLSSRRDPGHRLEIRATREMIEEDRRAGIGVRFVNPFGFLFRKITKRNHKKMILVDDRVTYIGGINFSDHNFRWHDMMVRIEDAGVATFMRSDFETTWNGNDRFSAGHFEGIDIYLVDGRSNDETFQRLFDLIGRARRSIFIESPYLSFPFYHHLRKAVNRGVAVTVLTPDLNNRKTVQRYTEWEAARSGISLRFYLPEMTHLKAMLVDDETLVVGSSNFDYLSCRTQQEVIAIAGGKELVSDFIRMVRDPDLENSRPAGVIERRRSTYVLYGAMRLIGKVAVGVAKF
jgi:cardiolipin synthase